MEREELDRYLAAGASHSVVIDVRRIGDRSEWLRKVTLHDDGRVTIEYPSVSAYLRDESEGGFLTYRGEYASIGDAIRHLELYLKEPLEDWRNYTRQPVAFAQDEDALLYPDHSELEEMVRRSAVHLPTGAAFDVVGLHWRHIAKFGVFRPDLVHEEQEARLIERYGEHRDDE